GPARGWRWRRACRRAPRPRAAGPVSPDLRGDRDGAASAGGEAGGKGGGGELGGGLRRAGEGEGRAPAAGEVPVRPHPGAQPAELLAEQRGGAAGGGLEGTAAVVGGGRPPRGEPLGDPAGAPVPAALAVEERGVGGRGRGLPGDGDGEVEGRARQPGQQLPPAGGEHRPAGEGGGHVAAELGGGGGDRVLRWREAGAAEKGGTGAEHGGGVRRATAHAGGDG